MKAYELGTGFSATLASWAATVSPRWPDATLQAAERGVVDTIACMISGVGDLAVQRVRQGLQTWGGAGPCSAVGLERGVDAPWAALINGTAAHALDYDDVLDPAASHVSAVLVPALLALADETGASGAEVLDAYIVGVEVQECLAEAVNMAHYTRGWHTTLTLGAPSAAAACARLLKLDPVLTRNAMSLATSMSGGFKRQFGTQAKPFHAGLGAKNGLLAARLAACGLTADPQPFEGARGFFDLMVDSGAKGFQEEISRLQGPTAIEQPGLWLKRYPCCASTHRAVDALLHLMQAHRLQASDFAHVDTWVSEAAVRNLMYDKPINEMQARFSMPYCLAAAALDGDLTLSTFGERSLARSDIRSLMNIVSMHTDPDQPAHMPSTIKNWALVTIETADGRRLSHRVRDPQGYPQCPLSEAELSRKYSDCAEGQTSQIVDGFQTWRHLGTTSKTQLITTLLRGVRPLQVN